MSKTTEVEGIYWWQDNKGNWHLSFDEKLIEEVRSEYGSRCYREKKKRCGKDKK